MRVLLQLRHTDAAFAAATTMTPDPQVTANIASKVAGYIVDATFPPIQIPGLVGPAGAGPVQPGALFHFSLDPVISTYLVRGEIPDGQTQAATYSALAQDPNVTGVFADPVIQSCLICGGDPASGTASQVRGLLNVSALHANGMDGTGVALAVVDSGVNLPHLAAHGQHLTLDASKSWKPAGVGTAPGSHPVGHGTMCAFDAAISAPQATLVDHAVLLSSTPGTTPMAGLLSDAVLSYAKLRTVLLAMPLQQRALVISNSWGMFSPTWDFPIGHPGNYSDNPNHPFNLMVASLEADGADILFAAGNCGTDCPDGRCMFGGTPPICGANSHPAVLSVGGVDITQTRVGYSSQGPGRLAVQKPDICAYTHFRGSMVRPVDGGTSAACPVAAGVIAAVRTKHKVASLSPLQLRALVLRTAKDLGHHGFDHDHGWGVIDPTALLGALP